MDMDQRTRMLGGGRGGRIILLGDGTEVLADHQDDDGDVDMEDRGEAEEEEKDLAEQVKKGQSQATSEGNGPVKERSTREETPAPGSQSSAPTAKVEEVKADSPELSKTSKTPDEPKMSVPVDTADTKKIKEEQQQQQK